VDQILRVDVLGVAHMRDIVGSVIAPGGAGVVIASMAGRFTTGQLDAQTESAFATAPTPDLLGIPACTGEIDARAGVLARQAGQPAPGGKCQRRQEMARRAGQLGQPRHHRDAHGGGGTRR
jgi:hypothetical protein